MEALKCPQCGHENFGTITCAQCHAILPTVDSPPPFEEVQETPSFSEPIIQEAVYEVPSEPVVEEIPPEPIIEEFPIVSEEAEVQSFDAPENPSVDLFQDLDNEVVHDASAGETTEIKTVEEFQDVDDSAGYRYDLKIHGIDLRDLHKEILQILSDPRLLLNTNEVPEEIDPQTGSKAFLIKGLSPARASYLVSKLQPFNVTVTWEQRSV